MWWIDSNTKIASQYSIFLLIPILWKNAWPFEIEMTTMKRLTKLIEKLESNWAFFLKRARHHKPVNVECKKCYAINCQK